MSVWLAIGIVAGLALAAWGLHVLSQALRSSPIDTLHPGPLIQRPISTTEVAPPPSLSLTEQLVEDALFSTAMSEHRLWPLVATLGREHRVDPRRLRPPDGDVRRWLDEMLEVLETP